MTVFDGIIGHRHVLDLLSAELINPAQAYLFVGPGSVGKAAVDTALPWPCCAAPTPDVSTGP